MSGVEVKENIFFSIKKKAQMLFFDYLFKMDSFILTLFCFQVYLFDHALQLSICHSTKTIE